MFGLFKRAAQSASRVMFLDTMRAVAAMPLIDQITIASRLAPEIGSIIDACQGFDAARAQGLLRFKLQTATARRQLAVANGAASESDPTWAEAALLESWCTAATQGAEPFEHATLTIDAWSSRIGFPIRIGGKCIGEAAPAPTAAPSAPEPSEVPSHGAAGQAAHQQQAAEAPQPAPAPTQASAHPQSGGSTSGRPDQARRFGCHKCGKVKVLDESFACWRPNCPVERI